MILAREDRKLLTEIGFLGISSNRPDEAAAIFALLCEEMPDNDAGFVGLAFARMAQGRPDAALDVLSRAPASDVTLAMSVLALAAAGAVPEARDRLAELETLGPAEDLLAMARAALDAPASAEGLPR
ncbi:MAG: tetratricopeptide repeat protein [Roseicyclus sp.]|jgi:hypothetical protein|nr:tetratricopeptide repeat protein [Roseicyclus sp.]